MPDVIDQFRQAIESAGLTPPDYIEPGKIHRFPGEGKHGSNKAGRCFMFEDRRGGWFQDYSTGLESTWQASGTKPYSESERAANNLRIQEAKAARDAETAQRQHDAAIEAERRFKAATPCTQHDYLRKKRVKHYGVKVEGNNLLIPMRGADGKIHSLQTITPDGDKRYLTGGRKNGCYFGIGKPAGNIIVCEGYATGASIHEATGGAVAVAFDAGNLEAVAVALHEKHPDLKIILAADDDYLTAGNPGMTKAQAAASAVGGLLAVPDFGQGRPDGATDFNDLHQLTSLDAVKRCIDAAMVCEVSANLPNADCNSVILINGADMTPEPVRWLWHNWLALGKLHILAGAPGQGKTTIAIAMAATVTIGGRWPDGTRCTPGNVLIWSGEDDPADTLLPRLLAAGADRRRCYFVSGTRINGEIQSFDPARDMMALELQARTIGGVKLLVVDPVVSAVAGDSHKNTEVRRALQPLVDLASRLDAAAVGISHFSKGGAGSDPASRVVGSIAFTAVARVVMVAAKVKSEDGDERRILARGKSNIGPDDGGFEYHIEQAEPLPGINASYIAWGQSVEGSARELLAEPEQNTADGGGGASAVEAAEQFLIDLLREAPAPTKHVQNEAKAAGISWAAVRRASDALGVRKRKGDGGWYWSKPNLLIQVAQFVQHSNGEHVEKIGEQVDFSTPTATTVDSEDVEVF